LLNDKTQPVKR